MRSPSGYEFKFWGHRKVNGLGGSGADRSFGNGVRYNVSLGANLNSASNMQPLGKG